MTNPFGGPSRAMPGLPTPPTGWPVGSYATYAEAQRAVDFLADNQFTVQDVTIVGVDLMLVERVLTRLTWRKVITSGAASGAWFGLLIGVVLSLVSNQSSVVGPLLVGLMTGVLFGVVFSVAQYASTRGRRDFASASQLVARQYDVLCRPTTAEAARDLLAKLAMQPPLQPRRR